MKGFIKKELLLLYLIVIAGAFLRLQGVITNSFAFTYDVGRDMLALWGIAHLDKIPLIGATTGINGVFYGPWWYYMLTPFYLIFSGNPQGIAFVMALFGIVCILLAYYLGKNIGNTFLGLSFAGLVSVSPQMVSLSSQIWNPNIAPLIVLLIFYSLLKIYKLPGNNLKYFLLLGLLVGLNIDVEILWGIFFAVGIILSQIVILYRNFNFKQILYFIFGLIFICLPRIVFEFRHGFIMTKSFLIFLGAKTTEDPITFWQLVQNRYFTFLDQISTSLTFGNQLIALILVVFALAVIVLFYKNASQILRKLIISLLIIMAVFIFGMLVFSHALWPHYLVGLPVIYILIFSIAIYLLGEKFNNKLIPIIIFISLFLINFNPLAQLQFFINPDWVGNASLYRNQLQVIDYVYKQANGKKFKYVVYTPPVYDYTYRYLFLWYGPEKYHYSPNDNARLAYFIIEPDPGYEDRPKQWLKLREKDGTIIKTTKLTSGIVVQTRVH